MLQIISTRRRFSSSTTAILLLFGLAAGCGNSQPETPEAPRPARPAATERAPAVRIVVLGDSLAAGLGLPETEAFPARVEALLRDQGYDVAVVNAGVSGDTSAGGLTRVEWVLQQQPDILIVELGGNDALRGQPLATTEANLRQIVRLGRASGALVFLAGMDVPTNYGPDYSGDFAGIFPRVAEEEGAVLVPGFVRPLGLNPALLQPDGLHPTAEGQELLARALLPYLVDALDDAPAGTG
jgi:acyl-CoA thioesterase-1